MAKRYPLTRGAFNDMEMQPGDTGWFQAAATDGSIVLTPGGTPSSPSDGAVWVTSAGIFVEINGSTIGPLYGPSLLFAQTQTVTVANTLTETNLDGTGSGSKTIAANYLKAGTSIRISALGAHSAVSNPNLRLRIYFGSTVLLDTGNFSTIDSTNITWELQAFITCRTTGATGTVNAQGYFSYAGGGFGRSQNMFGMVNTADTTIDTTTTQLLKVTAQWGAASASNSISCPLLQMYANYI